MSALATVLAQLAVAVLSWVASREDLKATVRQRLQLAADARTQAALEWLAASRDAADHGAGLQYRDGTLNIPCANADHRRPEDHCVRA